MGTEEHWKSTPSYWKMIYLCMYGLDPQQKQTPKLLSNGSAPSVLRNDGYPEKEVTSPNELLKILTEKLKANHLFTISYYLCSN